MSDDLEKTTEDLCASLMSVTDPDKRKLTRELLTVFSGLLLAPEEVRTKAAMVFLGAVAGSREERASRARS